MKFTCLLLLTTMVSAQSAKVIQLDAATSAEAAQLYAQRNEVEKNIEALEAKIRRERLNDPPCAWVTSSSDLCEAYPTPGWENGFVFSEDFKYIVPKPDEQQKSCSAPLAGWVHEALDDGSMPAESSMPLWDQDRHYYFHASGGGNTEGPVQEEWGDAGGYGNGKSEYSRRVQSATEDKRKGENVVIGDSHPGIADDTKAFEEAINYAAPYSIEIEPDNAQEMQYLFAQPKTDEIKMEIQTMRNLIYKRYIESEDCGGDDHLLTEMCSAVPLKGWSKDFVFSSDFRYICPVASECKVKP